MKNLRGKHIILGITGSIAAYKSATLVREFIKAGAQVRVLMTPAATRFITPLTLSTLSKNEVITEVVSGESWNNHVEMGLWADAMVVAPLTATSLAKMAHGICDNIIVADIDQSVFDVGTLICEIIMICKKVLIRLLTDI